MPVRPDNLLQADAVAAVAADRAARVQLLGRVAVDDDRVVSGDEVADALTVTEMLGLVVDPAREVVEQRLGGSRVQSGDDQLRESCAVSPTV